MGLVFLSFGERGRIQWESGPLGGGPGVPARSWYGRMDGWMDRCRAACKYPLGSPPGLVGPTYPGSAPSGAGNRQGPGRSWPWGWGVAQGLQEPALLVTKILPSLLPNPESPQNKDDLITALAVWESCVLSVSHFLGPGGAKISFWIGGKGREAVEPDPPPPTPPPPNPGLVPSWPPAGAELPKLDLTGRARQLLPFPQAAKARTYPTRGLLRLDHRQPGYPFARLLGQGIQSGES